jgi:hypothetical protein
VVDPSLLRQAADRGVTICFADLDGADGLWVPEERTVLVNRGLSDAAVSEVIGHELAHVMIDDQHADLDAGREVVVGRPPRRSRTMPAVLTAAALVAVVGGVTFGLAKASGNDKQEQVVAPVPTGGLTAEESGGPVPTTSTSPMRLPDGSVVIVTITVTATASLPTATPPAGSMAPTPSAKGPAARTSAGAASVNPSPTPSPSPLTPEPTTQSPTPAPTTEPPTPAPTTPAGTGAGNPTDGGDAGGTADAGDTGDAGGVAGTDAVGTLPAEATTG